MKSVFAASPPAGEGSYRNFWSGSSVEMWGTFPSRVGNVPKHKWGTFPSQRASGTRSQAHAPTDRAKQQARKPEVPLLPVGVWPKFSVCSCPCWSAGS